MAEGVVEVSLKLLSVMEVRGSVDVVVESIWVVCVVTVVAVFVSLPEQAASVAARTIKREDALFIQEIVCQIRHFSKGYKQFG